MFNIIEGKGSKFDAQGKWRKWCQVITMMFKVSEWNCAKLSTMLLKMVKEIMPSCYHDVQGKWRKWCRIITKMFKIGEGDGAIFFKVCE